MGVGRLEKFSCLSPPPKSSPLKGEDLELKTWSEVSFVLVQ